MSRHKHTRNKHKTNTSEDIYSVSHRSKNTTLQTSVPGNMSEADPQNASTPDPGGGSSSAPEETNEVEVIDGKRVCSKSKRRSSTTHTTRKGRWSNCRRTPSKPSMTLCWRAAVGAKALANGRSCTRKEFAPSR